ncbi:MAG: MBL fold metallo-hydrolase [Caldimicrobium sp.]|nr:MBL fold metallo-hydrolase [Caldimicrobium sp.]MCX7612689.1 MBL fold metallo-hydrolase [Caldimicrobium sp.]MDW8182451.1 MBL fold metallo-hydrolase [Caldimicrobium sp.]
MKLTVLGSGTGWLSLRRRAPGYLVSLKNFHMVLDLGPGTLYQILKIGISLEDISAIFLSHFHPDHVTDIIPFFFATRYNLGYQRRDPIYLVAHRNFHDFYNGLKGAFGQWVSPPEDLLSLRPVPTSDFYSIELSPFKVTTVGVNHNPESLAIKLEYNRKSLVYSGDTGWCEALIELARGVDLLIVECSNSKESSVSAHLGPDEIAEIAKRANPKRILISHFYPHSEHPDISKWRFEYRGEIILAEDLISVSL